MSPTGGLDGSARAGGAGGDALPGSSDELEQFLSQEDRDLATLTPEELWTWWALWFRAAQASNDDDEHLYSHGVLAVEPGYEHLLERVQWGC